MEEILFTPKEVCALLGVTRVTYINWISRGLIQPTYPSSRKGVASKFTRVDVLQCMLFSKLIGSGMTLTMASGVAFDKAVKKGLKNGDALAQVGLTDIGTLIVDLEKFKGVTP